MGTFHFSGYGKIDSEWIERVSTLSQERMNSTMIDLQGSPLMLLSSGELDRYLKNAIQMEMSMRIEELNFRSEGNRLHEIVMAITEPYSISSLSRSTSVTSNLMEDLREEFKREFRQAFLERNKR
jgi:hypothetical protein